MSVLGVSLSPSHSFSKTPTPSISLLPNLGVKGDAHAGATVQHRPHQSLSPPRPNLRQVHLMQSEILASVGTEAIGKPMKPGELGENITTTGVDLLSLGKGAKLRFIDPAAGAGDDAVATIQVTGLRDAGPQIDKFRTGLREKFVVRDGDRGVVGRRAGIMGIVESGGEVKPGMKIVVEQAPVYQKLECV
ncbi:hypothetical protein AJ79_05980 [Helicocarpus griseus UAMH5409]|uniref:MOSC domain-containing protein n=1 Tax=Helicocarpus griseus UAMH5409 TaxID=1447875 RepID=A0A2B7XI91_9EURO|nr:hypothetical protein AJ79_05980 [Helicocarpus griseus UAMH5409]